MVEFALVLPMLLVLLLGIADFGRVFAAGIGIESAARDAAEAVAQEYLRNPPGPMTDPAPAGDDAYYQPLHDLAARTACREARNLPGATYTPDNPATPSDEESCGTMPIIRSCIHDGADTRCGDIAFGASAPESCSGLSAPMSPIGEGPDESRYVEVRICYQFTTLVNIKDLRLPLGWGISVGEIWLEKDRAFAVGYYPPLPTPTPPPPPPPPPPTAAPPTPTPVPTPSPSPTGAPTATPGPTPTATPQCQTPLGSFTATPNNGKTPLTVQFTDTSTARNCPITSWTWNFGDGSPTVTTQNASHTFIHPGDSNQSHEFTVTLTVQSAAGPSQATAKITVKK